MNFFSEVDGFMEVSKRDMLVGALLATGYAAGAEPTLAAPAAAAAPDLPFGVWLAISRATQSYADCIDRLDMPGLTALFTPDCIYDYAPGVLMKGREGIEAVTRQRLGAVAKTSHHVGPPNVEPGEEPGTYRSTVYIMAFHQLTDPGPHVTVYGRYVDLFKADSSGRWLIAHRQVFVHAADWINGPRYWLPRHTV